MSQNPLTVGFSYLVREAARFLGYGKAAVYGTGTVTVVAGVVTLATGTFPSWLTTSHTFVYNDVAYAITTVTSGSSITLTDTTVAVSAGGSYWVVQLYPDQATDLIDCYRAGLRAFYYPPLLPKEGLAHRWSFLFPETTVTTQAPYTTGTVTVVAGVVTLATGTWPSWAASGELIVGNGRYAVSTRDSDSQITLTDTTATASAGSTYSLGQWVYALSSDFSAIMGPLTFEPNQFAAWVQVPITSPLNLHSRRTPFPFTGRPMYAAVRQKETFDPTTGQRYEMLLWPTPNTTYTMRYKYEVDPNNIDATNAYIRGGAAHMETMLESVLSACESKLNDTVGMHRQLFMDRLQASVSHDRKMMTPDTLGFDAQSQDNIQGSDYHSFYRPDFTYNGLSTS